VTNCIISIGANKQSFDKRSKGDDLGLWKGYDYFAKRDGFCFTLGANALVFVNDWSSDADGDCISKGEEY
jgi:hypothetical protein